jgi:malonate transporter
MLATALLLLPDFLLIALGFVVCRYTPLDRTVWDGAERLVYYLLFPVLLFGSIVKSPLAIGTALPLVGCGALVTLSGVAMAYALRRWPGVDPTLHASGAQCAFRFNSYVALALAERLAGAPGVALIALLVSVCVPIANVAAVWPLARHSQLSLGRELLRNPLIVATLAGLIANLLGLRLPDALAVTLQRIGGAALPLGLMAVGAGLRFGALREAPRLAAALLGIRHVALPLVALALVVALALPAEQRQLMLMFAAMPTASSAYVLAVRLGGHGGYVAGLVTLSTLIGMVAVPVWLALVALL